MNKLIFQLGILGFCVAAVVFGSGGGSIIDIVGRSFLVFVAITLAATVLVLMIGVMLEKNNVRELMESKTEQANSQQTPK